MASLLPMDGFHGDSDDDSGIISEVEWTKLKSTHIKEGYRDGYSAGHEDALQPAFDQSFTQNVRQEASVAFYRGILIALKAFVEKSRTLGPESRGNIFRIDTSQIAPLLAELDSFASRTDLTEGSSASVTKDTFDKNERTKELDELTSSTLEKKYLYSEGGSTVEQTACLSEEDSQSKCCMKATYPSEGGNTVEGTVCTSSNSKCACTSKGTNCSEGVGTNPLMDQTERTDTTLSENMELSHSPEGVTVSDETACCSAMVAASQQDNSEKNLSTDEGKKVTEFDHWLMKFRQISDKCKQLLNELGIGDVLDSSPFLET